ncbi:hypothetical protein ACOMHN_017050 [Nucella lapillus]
MLHHNHLGQSSAVLCNSRKAVWGQLTRRSDGHLQQKTRADDDDAAGGSTETARQQNNGSGCNLTTVNQSPCDNFRLQPDHSEPVSLSPCDNFRLQPVNQSPCDNFRLQPGHSELTAVVTANSHSHTPAKKFYTHNKTVTTTLKSQN